MNETKTKTGRGVSMPPLERVRLPGGAALPGIPGDARALTLRLFVLRLLTVPAMLLVALSAETVDERAIALLAAIAIAEILLTGWLPLRRTSDDATAPALPPLAVGLVCDVLLATLGAAASGGSESPILLIFVALPLVGALVLHPCLVVGMVLLGLAGRITLGGSWEQLALFAVVGGWTAAIGAATSIGAVRLRRRLTGLEATTAAVLARHPGGTVRAQVADGLRQTVLEPVSAIASELTHRPPPDALAVLSRRLGAIIDRARPTIRDLYSGEVRGPITALPGEHQATVEEPPIGLGQGLLSSRFHELAASLIVLRLGLVVVVAAVGLIVGGTAPGFAAVAVALAVVQVVGAWRLRRPRPAFAHLATTAIDVLLVSACFLLAGDARGALVTVVLVLVVACGFVYQPPLVTVVAALAIAITLVVDPGSQFVIAIVWAGACGVVESGARTRVGDRVARAVRRRTRILNGIVEAEMRERRRLAGVLHDGALQALIVGQQELLEAADDGAGAALAHAEAALTDACAALADAIGDIQIDEGMAAVDPGLTVALERATARPRGPRAVVAVDPAAEGIHDALLVLVAREAYVNAARHAAAEVVRVTVSRLPAGVALDVLDDGVGFDHERVRDAVDRGHIGLATLVERVSRAGGTVDLRGGEHGGGHLRVVLPATPLNLQAGDRRDAWVLGGR